MYFQKGCFLREKNLYHQGNLYYLILFQIVLYRGPPVVHSSLLRTFSFSAISARSQPQYSINAFFPKIDGRYELQVEIALNHKSSRVRGVSTTLFLVVAIFFSFSLARENPRGLREKFNHKIRTQDTSKLTHLEAQNLIKYAGTSAKIDLIR